MKLYREYPHIQFKIHWHYSDRFLIMLGQCIAYIRVINGVPIMPSFYSKLMKMSLIKGAQATTAIEGNTLTIEEILKLNEGEKLPPSKEYQEIELKNILEAFNIILSETIYNKSNQLISEDLLLKMHKMVGKDLGEHFQAIPGQFRNNDVIVGTYRAPDYRDIPLLIKTYCQWLREQFKYEGGKQQFSDVIVQAIVAHVYLEWIHPFSDGNGRIGRLVEYYILSRGGNPDIASHILSNHYNNTRPEYYRQLDKANKTRDLTEFLEYAVQGFRDGLQTTLQTIQESLLLTTWQKYVYDTFHNIEMGQRVVFKRRRTFGLELPLDHRFTFEQIPELNIKLARLYSGISSKTLERDIEVLIEHEILLQEGSEYFANVKVVNKMIARRKGLETK